MAKKVTATSETIKLSDVLYKGEALPIKVLGTSSPVKIGSKGPAGSGYSTSRPSAATAPAVYSGICYALDRFIVDHDAVSVETVNAADTYEDTYVYTEFSGDVSSVDAATGAVSYTKERFQAMYNTKGVTFVADDVPTIEMPDNKGKYKYDILVPILAYALSSSYYDRDDNERRKELRNLFEKIATDYNSKGKAEAIDVLKFCDSFKYGFADHHEEFTATPHEAALLLIQSGYDKGYFEFPEFLENIDFPEMAALEGHELRLSKKAAKKATSKAANTFESIKNGDHYLGYDDFTENQKAKIPSLATLDDFVPTPQFYSVLSILEQKAKRVMSRMEEGKVGLEALGKDYFNVKLLGKPGTGKTTVAFALGAALGLPVYSIPLTKNTEEDEFQGKTAVVNGGFDFVETGFLEAYTHGGIIILEEFNLADPAVVMGALGQAVEAPFQLMRSGYEPVRRHPMCFIIGTMNIGTYGSRGVSQAFASRFKQSYILNDPSKEDFVNILMSQGHPEAKCQWVYDVYNRVIDYLRSPEISREEICLNVTLRGCLGALECMQFGDKAHVAVQNSIIGSIAEVDLDLANDIYDSVVKALPDPKTK